MVIYIHTQEIVVEILDQKVCDLIFSDDEALKSVRANEDEIWCEIFSNSKSYQVLKDFVYIMSNRTNSIVNSIHTNNLYNFSSDSKSDNCIGAENQVLGDAASTRPSFMPPPIKAH